MCSIKKMFLKILQKSRENIWAGNFFLIKRGLRPATILKKTLAQVLSCEFCETCKNPFSKEHLWTTALANCYVNLIFETVSW